ncbi:MAG: PD40 domain-containing protein, partial [Ignavibacteriales bacterium]|nr:PD40 domain-containing protein [Ignavibacteriales bacterium]
MKHIAIGMMLLFSLSVTALQAQTSGKPTRGWLTVETIMSDPKWMGTSPSNVAWSEDGEKIYFNWRQKGDEGDSLYVVSAKGGTPQRVSLEEQKKLPSRFGAYTKDKTKKLYTKDGDIVLLDIKKSKELRLTNTVGAESNPRFSFDERKVVFERDGNVVIRDLNSGTEAQLTNLRSGSAQKDPTKTDLQKFLEQQQLELFDVLRERKDEREARKKFNESLEIKRPKPYYVGTKNAFGFVLSPDEHYITFILSQNPTDAKRANVPSYVTESGFTEEIPARTKVGEPQSTQELFVYNIALDSVMQIKPDDIAGAVPPKIVNDTSKSKPKARAVTFSGPVWSDDGKNAFVQLFSQDNKDRWITLLDVEKAKFGTLLERQHDDAWVGGPGIGFFGGAIA